MMFSPVGRPALKRLKKVTSRINRFTLTRLGLHLWAVKMPIWATGQAPVLSPETHQIWRLTEGNSDSVLSSVARTYVQVFSEKPWEENYTPEWVVDKLRRELANPACLLITFKGNATWPVAGFCSFKHLLTNVNQ